MNTAKTYKEYKNINEVWNDLNDNINIYWHNHAYKVIVEDAIPENEYQKNHHTFRNNKVLSIRHNETYFGGLMDESEIKNLFK